DDDGGGAALACSDLDASVLGPLVIVTAPSAAARVEGQFTVSGCAATLEQDVQYRVTDRSGGVLAEGFTTANAPDIGIAGEFSTQVDIGSRREGMLSLEVFEEDASDGEGGAPPRHVVPLVGG
ncbi:MAG: Gmad2 immunoglobulin-like domain-containing protein, partial [Thermoleophilia bacterium]|nr:Gmad2 immunoglobulin-like domain-containing protein [Thermoleophilia bacterium]